MAAYQSAVDWLYAARSRGLKLGLDNTMRLLEALGHPEREVAVLHVAGTNGKGSTCAMMDAILRHHGRRCGLFTSPHLVSFRERIRVDGRMISERGVMDGLGAIREATSDWSPEPTFFEITTVLALWQFAREGVDFAVLETGMGGRLDATNATSPKACAIGAIGMDHMQWLGDTLPAIAREKAGIIKPGTPVVCLPQVPEALDVIRARAGAMDAPLTVLDTPWHREPGPLPGEHQRWNAALAVATLRAAGIPLDGTRVESALDSLTWPGRFQVVDDGLVLDGAHNREAVDGLARTWRARFGSERCALLLAALADKDIDAISRALVPLAAEVVTTRVSSGRAMDPAMLAGRIRTTFPDVPVRVVDRPADALGAARATGLRVLAAGSLFLVGELLAVLGRPPE